MSQDIDNTRTLKVRVLLFVGAGTCGWVEGEFSPYEGTAAKDCGWNLGERLHSVVVGRVDGARRNSPGMLIEVPHSGRVSL